MIAIYTFDEINESPCKVHRKIGMVIIAINFLILIGFLCKRFWKLGDKTLDMKNRSMLSIFTGALTKAYVNLGFLLCLYISIIMVVTIV